MRHSRLAALSILLTAACARSSPESTIATTPRGLQYEGVPQGYEPLAGILLTDSIPNRKYGLSWLRGSHGEELWLEKEIASGVSGHPRWELRRALAAPARGPNEQLILGVCTRNGTPDRAVIAVAERQDADSLRTIRRAWRVNRESERFEPVAPSGIVCENEGWGA
jgi:hypothetical protein